MQPALRSLLPLLVACGGGASSDRDASVTPDSTDIDAPSVDASPSCPSGGAVEVLGTGGRPAWIAVDDTHVYWVTEGDPNNGYMGGVVMRTAKAGGTPTPLAMDEVKPVDVVVDATHVYWIRATAGTIMKVAKTGGTPALVANAPQARRLAIDATHLYWTRNNGGIGDVTRLPLAGGNAQVLDENLLGLHAIAVDATDAYYTTSTTIQRVGKTGGKSVTVMGTASGLPRGLALAAQAIYWTDDEMGGAVRTVAKAGGTASSIVTDDQPTGLGVDGTHVYWASDFRRIVKAPLAGGTPETLADNEFNPAELALDDCFVYWVDRETRVGSMLTGKVARRTKQ